MSAQKCTVLHIGDKPLRVGAGVYREHPGDGEFTEVMVLAEIRQTGASNVSISLRDKRGEEHVIADVLSELKQGGLWYSFAKKKWVVCLEEDEEVDDAWTEMSW